MSGTAVVQEASNAIGIHSPGRNHQSMIRSGDLIVDLERRIVTADGKPIRLSGKEYSILELLSLRLGVTVTKEMLLGHLYGGKDEPELKIIDVFVCHLRKKLAQATDGKHYIETVWGRGYRLCAPAQPHAGVANSGQPRDPPWFCATASM
jgi:two-component system cell cycle response regulator CtrA